MYLYTWNQIIAKNTSHPESNFRTGQMKIETIFKYMSLEVSPHIRFTWLSPFKHSDHRSSSRTFLIFRGFSSLSVPMVVPIRDIRLFLPSDVSTVEPIRLCLRFLWTNTSSIVSSSSVVAGDFRPNFRNCNRKAF